MLVADLTVEDSRLLGSMTRVPDKVPLPDDIQFQSAMLAPALPIPLPAAPPAPGPTTTIQSDLLANAYTNSNGSPVLANPTSSGTNNIADFASTGTTLLSLNDNDGNTWSIWELLQLFTSTKILSHPHVMARNNKEAVVSIGQTRWLVDKVKDISSVNYGGATTIQYKPIAANLTVKITPRISSASTVNLQVLVEIDEFISNTTNTTNNTKNIRRLETNANIKSGGIFALGGLIRTTSTSSVKETPFLGKIPIIGWFFKSKSNDVLKNNLTVFISPTIIEPRLRDGANEYTQDYINIAKNESRGNLFDSLTDPITRWFFAGEEVDAEKAIDKFVAKDETLPQNDITRKKNNPPKSKSRQNREDSTDILTHTAEGFVAENSNYHLPDLKKIIADDPNPFLKA